MNYIKSGFFTSLSLVLFFSSCTKKDTTPSNNANVTFMNACLNATALDATIAGTNVAGGTNLTFLKSSGYLGVTAGTSLAGFNFDAGGARVIDTSVNFEVSANYSVFAAGQITKASILVTSDDLLAPTSGMAKIRFINLSVDTPSMEVYIGATKLVPNSTFESVSPFMQLPAGAMNILAENPSFAPDQVQLSNYQFNSGKVYTVVLTGIYSASGVAALTLTVINNN